MRFLDHLRLRRCITFGRCSAGVEAQTVSNTYLAIENDLSIIPIINKVDLPSARIEDVKVQIMDLIGCDENDIIEASAKSGKGIKKFLMQ